MMSRDELEKIARQYQASLFPNILREYFQHLFLSRLYQLPDAEPMLFKGGTALRILYGSPRFSEDLDFSVVGVTPFRIRTFVEEILIKVLAEIEQNGITVAIGGKSDATRGGYFGAAVFKAPAFQPLNMVINVSARQKKMIRGEVATVAGDFVPAYTVFHLPQEILVEEKIFSALYQRKKPRDFYDLYFLLRRGLLSPGQKKRLVTMKKEILAYAKKTDFKRELGVFLPASQQVVIRDFVRMLEGELKRQISA